jgi:glycosyltransferase involved in cell wall biosynthesis
MRILYADTGLRGLEGHIASSAIALPPAFRRLGHEVTVLGHRDLVPSLRETTGAVPLFRFYTWGTWSPDPLIGWLADFTEILDATLGDLHRAWVEYGPFDFMYFNTVRAAQLAAVGLWLKETFPVQSVAPTIAVQLGPDPGLVRSGSREAQVFTLRDPTTVLHRYAAHLVGKECMQRLTLLAVNETVAEEYSFIVDSPVKALTTPEELPATRLRQPDGKLTVGFLGYQRIDKGYELLPDLIQQLMQTHPNVRFVVQHSDPLALAQEHPQRNLLITAKLRELADRSQSVELVLQPVVGSAWFELIDRCDMVALPYDPVRYASGYSAIFGEALASGAPIVAPGRTTMSAEIEKAGGVGVSFSQWTSPSIAMAIGQAVDSFDDLAARAYRGGVAWRTKHGPDAYVAQVLEGAGLTGPAGVTRLALVQGKHVSHKLPHTFLCNPQLQNGASIESARDSAEHGASRSGRIPIILNARSLFKRRQLAELNDKVIGVMNMTVKTTSKPWHYALTFDIDTEIVGRLPPKSQLTAEAIIEVGSGIIGIGWIDREHRLASTEQIVAAKFGTQRVTVSVRTDQAHRLMLRNAATDGRKAAFTLKSLGATASATLAAKTVA